METAKAVTTIGAHNEQLSGLIENADTTFQAIGSEQASLAAGLRLLPITLRQGNRTFAELPSTIGALTQLVNVSKPTSKPLTTLFARLRPLLTTATPVVHNFSLAISRPGPNNDLTDLANALPALAQALSASSPASVTALRESVPITAFFGPYSPDLEGTLRTFGQTSCLLRRQRPLRARRLGDPRLQARREQQPHPDHPAAEPGRPEDRPAAPLPGRGDAARGRRVLTVHGQRTAQLRPVGDALMDRRREAPWPPARC